MKSLDRVSGWHNISTYVIVKSGLLEFKLKRHAYGITDPEELAVRLKDYIDERIAVECEDALDRYKSSKLAAKADFRQIARFLLKHKPKRNTKSAKKAQGKA